MKTMPCVALTLVLFAWLIPVGAVPNETDPSSGAQSLSEIDLSQRFRAERRRIESGLEPRGRYGGLSDAEKNRIRESLQRAHEKIGGSGRLADLNPGDQVVVFNELARINAMLAQAPDGSREICERVSRAGSKIPETVCYTEAEMREQSRGARGAKEYLEQRGRVVDRAGSARTERGL
ncbi:MAG: hypothetical protein R3F04_07605 [Lysobacteraceae bacterium]